MSGRENMSDRPEVCPHCQSDGKPFRPNDGCDCFDYDCGSSFECGESVTEPRGFYQRKSCELITKLQKQVTAG